MPILMTSPQVCQATGASYRMLDYWCRTGIITPMHEARGSGTQRRFHVEQLPVIRVVQRLAEMGGLHRATEALRALPPPHPTTWCCYLVVPPAGPAYISETLLDLADAAWVVALTPCLTGVAEQREDPLHSVA